MGSVFLPVFALTAILLLLFIDLSSSVFFLDLINMNGEIVYMCGFLIVFYIIWLEGFQTIESFLPTFTFSNLAFFWLQYKKIELILLKLISLKIKVVETILNIFLFSAVTLRVLNNLKINNFLFRLSINSLNKVRIKMKSLPLQ